MPRPWYDDDRVLDVLDEGELLHVGVATRRGPRVTPTAFSLEGRQLWFAVARGSVKARVIAQRRQVGGLVRAGDKAVVINGDASIVDPLTARGIASVDRLLDLPFAAGGYLGRNVRHAAGVLRARPTPTLPASRVAVVVDITRGALVDDDTLVAEWGVWEKDTPPADPIPRECSPPDLTQLPGDLHALLDPGTPVVLGWETPSGPVVVPARWRDGTAEAGRRVMELLAPSSQSRACITSDRSGSRLADKQGVLMSGEGHTFLSGDSVAAAIDYERLTWWVGDDLETVRI